MVVQYAIRGMCAFSLFVCIQFAFFHICFRSNTIPYSVYYSRSSGKSSEVAEAQLRCDGRCSLLGAQQIESILIYCKLLCRRHMSIISCWGSRWCCCCCCRGEYCLSFRSAVHQDAQKAVSFNLNKFVGIPEHVVRTFEDKNRQLLIIATSPLTYNSKSKREKKRKLTQNIIFCVVGNETI